MAYTRRKFNSHIKSLIHFDFPYFNEPFDGCRDEISGNIFTRKGNVKFCGNEKPCDEIISGTPKFGYRCLHSQSQNDYISAMNTGQFDILSGKTYELECFVRLASSSTGNIISFMNGSSCVLSLGVNQENKITVVSSGLKINLVSSGTLSLNTWYYVKAQITESNAKLYLKKSASYAGSSEISILDDEEPGEEEISEEFYEAEALTVTEIRIGGFSGYVDEFVMRDTLTSNSVPASPYQGTCDIMKCGGTGTGTTSAEINANTTVNSYAYISKASGRNLTLEHIFHSSYSDFTAGTEIMIHVSRKKTSSESELGRYAFRRITGVSGSVITLDSDVTEEFSLSSCVNNYYVQAVTVPNFRTLTVSEGVKIAPANYAQNRGAIVAMRISGTCTLNGSIITSDSGLIREDKLQMTHSELLDRFLVNKGGGIYIVCGGTFTCTNTDARLGATWDGSAKGGQSSYRSGGTDGGAGYGGGGGSDGDSSGLGGKGGVGGGGGGADGKTGRDAGNSGTGGDGAAHDRSASTGGTAGINLNSENDYVSGGGGAGGNAGTCEGAAGGVSGACLVLIAKKIKCVASSISTGGRAGNSSRYYASSGGGTGFAYLACEELN